MIVKETGVWRVEGTVLVSPAGRVVGVLVDDVDAKRVAEALNDVIVFRRAAGLRGVV